MERDRRGRLPWTIVVLVLVFSCLTAFALSWIYLSARTSGSFASYTTVHLNAISSLQVTDDGFVSYDGSSLVKTLSNGKTQWSYIVGGAASFQADTAGVSSWTGNKLTIITGTSGTPSYSGTMDREILSAHVGSEYSAVLLGPEHNSTIVLMENGGRRVDSIDFAEQTVIDYGFFASGDSLFWVMTLDTNGTAPGCTISTYRPGRRMVGSITDSEQTLYHVIFESSQIHCVGDTYARTYTYNGLEETDKRRLVYGWTLVSADDHTENPLAVYTLNGQYDQGQSMHDLRLVRGSDERIVRLPYACQNVYAFQDRAYGLSTEGAVCIASLNSQKVSGYQLALSFDTVYGMTSDLTAVLGEGNDIYLISLAQ